MEIWILTMILTLGGGSSPRPAVDIHTQEYLSLENCEVAKKIFIDNITIPSKSMDENKQAFCLKK
jgi:hypothetical protein